MDCVRNVRKRTPSDYKMSSGSCGSRATSTIKQISPGPRGRANGIFSLQKQASALELLLTRLMSCPCEKERRKVYWRRFYSEYVTVCTRSSEQAREAIFSPVSSLCLPNRRSQSRSTAADCRTSPIRNNIKLFVKWYINKCIYSQHFLKKCSADYPLLWRKNRNKCIISKTAKLNGWHILVRYTRSTT